MRRLKEDAYLGKVQTFVGRESEVLWDYPLHNSDPTLRQEQVLLLILFLQSLTYSYINWKENKQPGMVPDSFAIVEKKLCKV